MRLGTVIRKWRIVTEVPVEDVAKEIGISKDTLIRIEKDEGQMSARTFIKVLDWLTSDKEFIVEAPQFDLEVCPSSLEAVIERVCEDGR